MRSRFGRTRKIARFEHGEPIRRLSIAPLAGLVLIAATMIALSYPMQTHALTFEVYPTDWPHPNDSLEYHNLLELHANGQLRWNGEAVTKGMLAERLNRALSEPVEPALIFQPDDYASYLAVAEVLLIVKQSGISALCIAGLERNRHFELPEPDPNMAVPQWFGDCDVWLAGPPR